MQGTRGGGGETGPVTLMSSPHTLGELGLEMVGKPQGRDWSPGGRGHGETALAADQP